MSPGVWAVAVRMSFWKLGSCAGDVWFVEGVGVRQCSLLVSCMSIGRPMVVVVGGGGGSKVILKTPHMLGEISVKSNRFISDVTMCT